MIQFVETPTTLVNEEDNLRGRLLLARRDAERLHDRLCELLRGKIRVNQATLIFTRSMEASLENAMSSLGDLTRSSV